MLVKRALDADPLKRAKCVTHASSAPHRAAGQAMEVILTAQSFSRGDDLRLIDFPRRLPKDPKAPVNFPLSPWTWGTRVTNDACRLARSPLDRINNGRGRIKSASSGTSSPQSTYSPSLLQARMHGSSGHSSVNGDLDNNVGREPRMHLSTLLVDPYARCYEAFSLFVYSDGLVRTYQLEVIQHPLRTAEFGSASSLSRLPLTPPIVVQLTVRDGTGHSVFP